jgi:hypothetical protein
MVQKNVDYATGSMKEGEISEMGESAERFPTRVANQTETKGKRRAARAGGKNPANQAEHDSIWKTARARLLLASVRMGVCAESREWRAGDKKPDESEAIESDTEQTSVSMEEEVL